MQTLYLKEYNFENKQSFIEKIAFLYKRLFYVFDIKEIENMVICSVPIDNYENTKYLKRVSKKICKKFFKIKQKIEKNVISIPRRKNEYIVNKVLLSNKLKEADVLTDELKKYKIDILNGKWLFKYLIVDVLDYISDTQNICLETKNIAILINDNCKLNMNYIILIAKRAKRLSIVTKNISKFRFIEEKLYNEYGIAIEISNNRRKSLANIDLIINIDFDQETINKYRIKNEVIIINTNEKKDINFKALKGVIIDDFEIEYKKISYFEENNLCKYFDKKLLYESYIYRKDNLYNILNQLEQDKVKITKLLGNYNNKIITKTLDKIEKLS